MIPTHLIRLVALACCIDFGTLESLGQGGDSVRLDFELSPCLYGWNADIGYNVLGGVVPGRKIRDDQESFT